MRTPRFKRFKKFRKTYHRRFKVRRPRIKGGFKIHYFKRTVKQTVALSGSTFYTIPSITAATYNAFQLDQLPNYTDFTNLYDSYKISGIKRKFIFDKNSCEVNTGIEIPRLITVNDYNDQAALTNENEALEYTTCKQTRLDRITSRYFRPTIQPARSGTGDANTEAIKSRWLRTDQQSDVSHMGIKEAIIASVDTALGSVHIYTTYYIACRTPR